MEVLSHNVAMNLRHIRKVRNMSLDAVAEQTGISKSMLGQIEREQSNPTIAVLGKIVSGLRVEFSDLINVPPSETCIVERNSLRPVKICKDRFEVLNFFPYEKERNFEIYQIQIQPGQKYARESHGENTIEYVMVQRGQLTLTVDNKTDKISQGDAVRFSAERPHVYENRGNQLLELCCVFQYREV